MEAGWGSEEGVEAGWGSEEGGGWLGEAGRGGRARSRAWRKGSWEGVEAGEPWGRARSRA